MVYGHASSHGQVNLRCQAALPMRAAFCAYISIVDLSKHVGKDRETGLGAGTILIVTEHCFRDRWP